MCLSKILNFLDVKLLNLSLKGISNEKDITAKIWSGTPIAKPMDVKMGIN